MLNKMALRYRPFVAELQDVQDLVQEFSDHLKEKLPEACGLRVNGVTLRGSLGFEVCYTRQYDCEIILYSQDIDPNHIQRHGQEVWLHKIDQLLQTDQTFSSKYDFQKIQELGLTFLLGKLVDVKLILCPWWGRPQQFYIFLESIKPQNRSKFFSSAAKWQMVFLKQQPNQDRIKELTKRVKAWRDRRWLQCTGARGQPSTYLLALLILKAYTNAQKRLGIFSSLSPDTMAYHTSEELKKIVHNHNTVDIWWEHCYSLKQYPTLVPPSPPRILDPANPTNNLYYTGISHYVPYERRGEKNYGDGHWTTFRSHIDSLDLSKSAQHQLSS